MRFFKNHLEYQHSAEILKDVVCVNFLYSRVAQMQSWHFHDEKGFAKVLFFVVWESVQQR